MGAHDSVSTDLRTLVVGCTPLARKVANLLGTISDLVGVVNLHPSEGANKSNYDSLSGLQSSPEIFWTKNINDDSTIEWIRSKKPEVIVQCGWSQIFKKEILQVPERYCLGIHPSPLPIGRGAAILNWKIIESGGSDVEWGNSLFVMEEKTDTGAVLGFQKFVIESRDDIRTAYQKADQTSLEILKREIPNITYNTEKLSQQNNKLATRYYKRKPEDGLLHLDWSAVRIKDYIRALTHPYPGAFLKTKRGDLTVWEGSVMQATTEAPCGTIMMIFKEGIVLKCGGNTDILIKRVSYNGVEYWADEYANLESLRVGETI